MELKIDGKVKVYTLTMFLGSESGNDGASNLGVFSTEESARAYAQKFIDHVYNVKTDGYDEPMDSGYILSCVGNRYSVHNMDFYDEVLVTIGTRDIDNTDIAEDVLATIVY